MATNHRKSESTERFLNIGKMKLGEQLLLQLPNSHTFVHTRNMVHQSMAHLGSGVKWNVQVELNILCGTTAPQFYKQLNNSSSFWMIESGGISYIVYLTHSNCSGLGKYILLKYSSLSKIYTNLNKFQLYLCSFHVWSSFNIKLL